MLQRLQENKSFEDDLLQARPMTNSKSTISRSPIPSRAKSTAMKLWFAGSIRCVAPCRRRCLFRWQKIGLINALGEWVLKTACAEAASWATPLKVSVNVSPIQLMNTSLTDTIIEVLHQTGLDPRRLDLEITESDVFNETPVRWKFSASCASWAFRSPSMTLVPAILPCPV